MSANEELIVRAVLAGTREYLANSQQVVAGNEEMATSTELLGRTMESTRRRSYLMSQAIFTVRRLLYGFTLGALAGTAALAHWGWQFLETKKSATIALLPMLGNIQAVNAELGKLFQIAKYSPFTFQDTTVAFRNMYIGMHQLGISADTVNTTIQSVVDSLSAAGKSTPQNLNRAAYALQHMAYQGRLTGYIVNQLGRDGINVTGVLRKEFGLTGEQIHNVGKLGIPVLTFLDAFNRYVKNNPAINGAAARQAAGSWSGLWAQFKDSMSQIMGVLEQGFFNRMIKRMQELTGFLTKLSDSAQGGRVNISQMMLQIGGPNAVLMWTRIVDVLHQFWILFTTVVSAISHSMTFWAAVYTALTLLSGALHIINPFLQAFGGLLLDFLIPALITYWTVTKVAAFWTGVLALEDVLATKATKDLTFFQFLAAIATGRYAIAAKIAAGATLIWNGITKAAILLGLVQNDMLEVMTVRLYATAVGFQLEGASAAVAWALTLGPIALIIGGLAAIAAAIYLIITRWNQFKAALQNSGTGLWNMIGIHPERWGSSFSGYTGGGIGGNLLASIGAPSWLTGAHKIPHQATGGVTTSPGLSWVGENGPELMHMPRGATVTPLSSGGLELVPVKAPIVINLDGRKIADAVAMWQIKTAGTA